MGPPPFMKGVRGWISVSRNVGLEGLYGRVSLQGLCALDSHGLEGSQFVGDHHDVIIQHRMLLP